MNDGPGSEPPHRGPGEALAVLFLTSPTWMHRRVESLRLNEGGGTRLRVSVDVTVPELLLHRESRRTVLPLALVGKGAMKQLDTRNAAFEALPVMTERDNEALVVGMLLALAENAVGREVARSRHCREAVEAVVQCHPAEAEQAVAAFRGWLGAQRMPDRGSGNAREVFVEMVGRFGPDFLLAVEMERATVGARTVVKYSYEDRVPEVRRLRMPTKLGLAIPNFAMAASIHFEMAAPPGVGLRHLAVQETEPDQSPGRRWADVARHSRDPDNLLHVACTPSHRFTAATAEVSMAPPARGVPSVTMFGAVLTAALVGFAVVNRVFPGALVEEATPTSIASVLLVGPAVLLSWLSRAPEHVLVARLLWPFRRLLITSAFGLLALAMLLEVPLVSPWEDSAWTVLCLVQSIAAVAAVRLYASVRTRD